MIEVETKARIIVACSRNSDQARNFDPTVLEQPAMN
jgi:hypothetical protein